MGKVIYENYTEKEIEKIIKNSVSWKDFARKLGYSNSPSGDTIKMLKKKTEKFDTSHFSTEKNEKVVRNEDNIFIENSTASQSTLRKWYLKGNYSKYECVICNQQPFWNGKELTLILDHINGKNNDDRLENLRWVCPNCNQQLDTTGSRNPNRSVFQKKYFCEDCGKEISKYSTRCSDCNNKKRIIPVEQMPITREELKIKIRNMPFTKIGLEFGVSDNAVRKWCDKYNLPRKSTEIKKISDENWEKI